jgi:hypothetical protein
VGFVEYKYSIESKTLSRDQHRVKGRWVGKEGVRGGLGEGEGREEGEREGGEKEEKEHARARESESERERARKHC